ncbi:sensor histidine kinase [Modestobacter sp. Leaf380]|uniref:sensor histidine kinase n=1 Tax=Modestobacter sp. Leaf380 TaxID=1736356 RepID=UPI001910A0D2|nr:sensor histidine kinase [Modestobacter sp. Leaf380]
MFFGVVAIGTMASVLVLGAEPLARRWWAVAALAALSAWYARYGRPLIRDGVEDHRAYVYLAGAALLFVPAVALVSSASFALFALCPQAYMLMSALRATLVVLALNVMDVGVAYLGSRDWADTAEGPLPVAVLVVLASAVFGTWARGVALENDERAVLIDELTRSRAEVARLSHEAGALAERQRLAGEVHDTVAQGLTSIIMLVQAAEAEVDRDAGLARQHLALALDAARDNLHEARAIVGALTPRGLEGSSLADALSRLTDRFTSETGTPATFRAGGSADGLPTAVQVAVLRATQESLTNVHRHAGAASVAVDLERGEDLVVVRIADDGCGFDPATRTGGYGLSGMRARVQQVSGTLEVSSVPGRGTTVQVEVPVR